jgi:hypothetical protein
VVGIHLLRQPPRHIIVRHVDLLLLVLVVALSNRFDIALAVHVARVISTASSSAAFIYSASFLSSPSTFHLVHTVGIVVCCLRLQPFATALCCLQNFRGSTLHRRVFADGIIVVQPRLCCSRSAAPRPRYCPQWSSRRRLLRLVGHSESRNGASQDPARRAIAALGSQPSRADQSLGHRGAVTQLSKPRPVPITIDARQRRGCHSADRPHTSPDVATAQARFQSV